MDGGGLTTDALLLFPQTRKRAVNSEREGSAGGLNIVCQGVAIEGHAAAAHDVLSGMRFYHVVGFVQQDAEQTEAELLLVKLLQPASGDELRIERGLHQR